MSKNITTKNTSDYVDVNGKFRKGNKGKPRGAANKTTKEVREFITNFLNDKAYEIPHIWDALDDKDKATLYLHLCRLVLPKPPEATIHDKENFTAIKFDFDDTPLPNNRPVIQVSDPDKD